MSTRALSIVCLSSFLLCLSPATGYSAMKDCKSPATITLGKDVSIVFCTVPAMHGMDSFQMGQFEVTQLQYRTVMRDEPWKAWKGATGKKGEHGIMAADRHPAVYLTNDDAVRFANKLSQLDRSALYRLPTQDEWENAARGVTTTEFFWGDHFKTLGLQHSSFAYCDRADLPNAQDVTSCPDRDREKDEPGFCANQFGLMHILGNVWEWTSTVTMGSAGRAICGGGWYGSVKYCRPTVHSYANAFYRDIGLGFRLVRIPR